MAAGAGHAVNNLAIRETPSLSDTAAVPSIPEPCTDIASDGDVILELSSSERFRVYSQVLCSSSTVFNRMLSTASTFKEAVALRSRGEKPITVPLEDDDAGVLLIILRVLHCQLSIVPRKLPMEQLVQAAILCDKYLLHESMQLIASTWIESSMSPVPEYPDYWLWISWVFGPEDVFTEASRSLMLEGSCVNGQYLVTNQDKREIPEYVPPSIGEKILKSRQSAIDKFRAEVDALETMYLHSSGGTNYKCSANSPQCDLLQLGLLYQIVLVNHGNPPWSGNLSAIVKSVADLKSVEYVSAAPDFKLYCLNCGAGSSNPTAGSTVARPTCGCYNYTYCPCCGTRVNSNFNNHYCTNAASPIPSAHDGTRCSWVPGLQLKIEKIMQDVKGLKFAQFQSRVWV